jgi:glycosyltransferase involved in cell wall biosynthesis
LFYGTAGYVVSRIIRQPWVLEIRDLWPEEILGIVALRDRRIISMLEGVGTFLYRRSDHVVAVTHAVKRHIKARCVPDKRISVIANGADLVQFKPQEKYNGFRKRFGSVRLRKCSGFEAHAFFRKRNIVNAYISRV